MTYQLIYVDPPWQYGNKISNGAAENHYETMSLVELKRPLSGIWLLIMPFLPCGTPAHIPRKRSSWQRPGVFEFAP